MVLATPIFGPVIDPGQDMHSIDIDTIAKDPNGAAVPSQFQREGSVVSDAFGPPVAGPSTSHLETIDEDNGNDAGPTTHSAAKEKGKAKEKMPAPPSSTAPEKPEYDQYLEMKLSTEAQDQIDAMVKALAFY